MYAIEAIYDGINFKPMQPIPVDEKYKVVITFLEPIAVNAANGEPQKPAKLPRFTAKGLLCGKVWMSDDFNEPLEELKEYI